jgi:hypothetical protein
LTKTKPRIELKGKLTKQDWINYRTGTSAKGNEWHMLSFSVLDYATQEWTRCVAWGGLAQKYINMQGGADIRVEGEMGEYKGKPQLECLLIETVLGDEQDEAVRVDDDDDEEYL